MSAELEFGAYIAALPYQVGYALDERHVVAVALSDDGRPGPTAAAQWGREGYSDRDFAEAFAGQLAQVSRAAEARRFVLVGYGTQGEARAELLCDALLATADLPGPILVHVEADTWRVRAASGTTWSPAQRLPAPAAAVYSGEPAPAADRAALAARFAPLEGASFAVLPERERTQLAASPPSLRVDVATRVLSQLATPGSMDDPARLATLAHLVDDSSLTVRDAVLLAAASDDQRTEALVRCYRGAPAEQRPPLATVTAAAVFLRGGQTAAVEEVLRHADREGRHANLTGLVESAATMNANPHDLRRTMAAPVERAVAEADDAWEHARSASLRAVSFPATGTVTSTEAAAARVAPAATRSYGPAAER